MNKFVLALIFSLVLHLSQYGLISYWPSLTNKSQIETTEIELISNQTSEIKKVEQEKPIIKSIVDKKNKIEMNPPAEFRAQESNRTLKQTRAQESGQFRNSADTKKNTEVKIPDGDFFRQQNQLPSRSEYQLPEGIQIGSATNLNTDADIYASFYNRVTDLFYIRWIQKLDQIWMQTPEETKKKLSGRRWLTDVEILLNSDGRYNKGIVLKNSGFDPFDQAAIFGFSDAHFFPNPPKAKVDRDGFIRLKYRISVIVR